MTTTTDYRSLGLELDTWQYSHTRDPRPIDDVAVPNVWAEFFTQEVAGEVWSLGRFYFQKTELLRAWGRKADPHCSYHLLLVEPQLIHDGCPQMSLKSTAAGYQLHLQGEKSHFINLY